MEFRSIPPRPHRLGVTLLLVLLGTGIRFLVDQWIHPALPSLFYHGAILLAAVYGGTAMGLLATLLSAGALLLFLVLGHQAGPGAVTLLLGFFILQGALVSTVIGRLDEARHEAEEQHLLILEKESELALYAQEVSRLSGLKDHVLAMVAHELRNLLNPISMNLQLARARPGQVEALERLRESTARQLVHLERVIADLTQTTQIAQGDLSLELLPLDLKDLGEEIAGDYRERVEQEGIRFTSVFGSMSCPIEADPTRLKQVFANLLGNALKFTPAGGEITLWVARREGGVGFGVRDTGMGIEASELDQIFEPFIQGLGHPAPGRGMVGLGLGLSIVLKLVELHGGRIQAHSQGRGHGSELVGWLPLAPGASPDRYRREQGSPSLSSSSGGPRR